MPAALPRSKVRKNQTWNAESVFASPEAFNAEVNDLVESLAGLRKFQAHLGDGPDMFLDAMERIETISRRAAKVQVYASMSSAATCFIDPELLAVGEEKLRGWLAQDPRMKLYEHYFNDLFRKQTHVRSAEVEELLGMLRDPFSSTSNTAS